MHNLSQDHYKRCQDLGKHQIAICFGGCLLRQQSYTFFVHGVTFGTLFLLAGMVIAAHFYKKEREVRPDKRFDESCKVLGLPTQQEIKDGKKVKLPQAP